MVYTYMKVYLVMILKVRRKKEYYFAKRCGFLIMTRRQARHLYNMSSKSYMGSFHLEVENY